MPKVAPTIVCTHLKELAANETVDEVFDGFRDMGSDIDGQGRIESRQVAKCRAAQVNGQMQLRVVHGCCKAGIGEEKMCGASGTGFIQVTPLASVLEMSNTMSIPGKDNLSFPL